MEIQCLTDDERDKSLSLDSKSLPANIPSRDGTLPFKDKWKDPTYRGKCLYSAIMTTSAVSTGMYIGQHGPTFLDIQIITDTDFQKASTLFTAESAGILSGVLFTGIIYNKVEIPLLLCFMSIGMGGMAIALPYCTQFELMAVVRFVSAVFNGSIATGMNTQMLAIWGAEGHGLMQLLHFGFSVGGMVAPLIAEPFLLDKDLVEFTNTTTAVYLNDTTSLPVNASRRHLASESRVQYVFLITGLFTLFTAIPYVYIYFSHRGKNMGTVADKNRKFSREKVPFKVMLYMLAGTCVYLLLWNTVEPVFFAFLMSFLVEGYSSVSKSKGAFVTALAWGSFAVTRFFLIFLTRKVTPSQLLSVKLTLLVFSFSAFSVSAYFEMVDVMIVFVATSSILMAGIFPASFSWVETELFQVTGKVGSCILVSTSIGCTLNPLLIGTLMEQYSNMWYCYLLLIQMTLAYFIWIALATFSKFYVDKRYGSLAESSGRTKAQEIIP